MAISDDQIIQIRERLQQAIRWLDEWLPKDSPHSNDPHDEYQYERGDVLKTLADVLALVDKLRSDRDEVVSQSVELNAVFEAVMDTLDGRQVSDFMSSFQPVLIAQDAIEGREASLARLRTEVEGLHQERDEIRSALGLMAGGVGLSLAEEIEEIKHQRARLRTALVGLRSHWRNWCASSRPQVYNPVYREWHTTAESRMDQEVEAALASTRPDAER